jgi:hypothetical protein
VGAKFSAPVRTGPVAYPARLRHWTGRIQLIFDIIFFSRPLLPTPVSRFSVEDKF